MKKQEDVNALFIEIEDELTPYNSVCIPNDFVDKYMKLFKGNKQLEAVLDLIKQSYQIGVENGAAYEKRLK